MNVAWFGRRVSLGPAVVPRVYLTVLPAALYHSRRLYTAPRDVVMRRIVDPCIRNVGQS